MSKDDPTDLRNVLAALDNSEKLRHWHKPPQDYGPDNPEYSEYNRNGLTDPGDLSMVSFTEEFAFGESPSDESDGSEEKEDEEEEVPFSDDLASNYNASLEWMDPAEETQEDDSVISLQIAKRAHYQCLLSMRLQEMALDAECRLTAEQKTINRYKKYMREVMQIRNYHDAQMENYLTESEKKQAIDELKLRQQEEDANQAVQQREEEYSQYVRQKSSELNKLAEDAERREAEQRNIIQGFANELHTLKSTYLGKYEQMKQLLRDLNGEQTLDPSVEAKLNEVVTNIDGILESVTKDNITQDDLVEKKKYLQMNITYVDRIMQALYVRKEEKQQLETERANQQAEQARREEAAAMQKAEQQSQAVAAAQSENYQKEVAEREDHQQMAILVHKNRMRYEELMKKMEGTLNVQNEINNEKKKDVGRIIAIINQLDGIDHNINKEKLQKLLNFLAGRNLLHNNKSYCTNNDPLMTAYSKNRLMSHIVKIGHDIIAKNWEARVAAYAWLVVGLVAVHPDIWEIFLYHLYTTCPYLVPLYILQMDGQDDEDYDKARGKKPKEKNDAYFSRMGNAAFFFGLILAKMNKKDGMPESAAVVGWKLLAGLLTLDPTPGVSAVVLEGVLNGAGSELQQTYGKQFTKLMTFAIDKYLPKVEEVSSIGGDGQQSLNQLKVLFEEYRRTGKIKPNPHLNKFN